MQKGGRINYVEDEKSKDKKKWVGSHPASKKEAEALNLLDFNPTDTSTSMTTGVYKNIYKNPSNFNGSIKDKFIDLSIGDKKMVIKLFLEAVRIRNKMSKKNMDGTISDNTHDVYKNLLDKVANELTKISCQSNYSRGNTGSKRQKVYTSPRKQTREECNPPGAPSSKRTISKITAIPRYELEDINETIKQIIFEDIEDIEDIKDIEDIEDSEDIEDIEDSEDIEDIEDIEYPQHLIHFLEKLLLDDTNTMVDARKKTRKRKRRDTRREKNRKRRETRIKKKKRKKGEKK